MRRLRFSHVLFLIIIGAALVAVVAGVRFIQAMTYYEKTTMNVQTSVHKAVTITDRPSKTPLLQLLESAIEPGHMAVYVATGYDPKDIIPANTMIKIRLVTKDGLLILDQTVIVRKNSLDYEFVIPLSKNSDVCRGRPLYISIWMETPNEIYSYKGRLPEWSGIEDMCLPFLY